MKDAAIYKMVGEVERKVALQNMALNKFAQESSHHLNSLVLSFNAVKNLLVEKNNMTNEEIDKQILIELEKANAKPEEIIEEVEDGTTGEGTEGETIGEPTVTMGEDEVAMKEKEEE